MIQTLPTIKFTNKIDRRNPRDKGDYTSPYLRENWLARDGVLKKPRGTERAINPEFTKLLIHFDGADGLTSYTAETGQVVTFAGNAQLDTAQFKFGTASLLLDGTGDYVSIPDSADWDFGTGDYEVDLWINPTTIANNDAPFSSGSDTDANGLRLYFTSGALQLKNGATVIISDSTVITTGVWTHIAIVRFGATTTLYINGYASTSVSTSYNVVVTNGIVIGRQHTDVDSGYFDGWIDEVRVSKGNARWTENFAPGPTVAHSYSANSVLSAKPTWTARYSSLEVGIVSPKTFIYTIDGKLWIKNEQTKSVSLIKTDLKTNAYPKHCLFKLGEQVYLYLVDGLNLYRYDGNNDNKFEKVTVNDSDGNPVEPIDVIEHIDRLVLISSAYVFISKNLAPENFSDSTDAIQIIVGSGRGRNIELGKIRDNLYIGTTQGIYGLFGDVISAVASTFEVRLVANKNLIGGRTWRQVENALVGLFDDLNAWSFDGSPNLTKLSHDEKLEDFVHPYSDQIKRAVSTYYNNYYMLSFVETGQYNNNLEFWWDALENKGDFVRGRMVSCYLEIDKTIEQVYQEFGRSDISMIMLADTGYYFDSQAIVSKLWTKDITVAKGRNVRLLAFMPEFQPTGNVNVRMSYFLDGRLTDQTGNASWTQSLRGDYIGLGLIQIANQSQFIDRVRPKINYSRGASVAFFVNDATHGSRCDFMGIGLQFIPKDFKKGKAVGK